MRVLLSCFRYTPPESSKISNCSELDSHTFWIIATFREPHKLLVWAVENYWFQILMNLYKIFRQIRLAYTEEKFLFEIN